MTMINPSLRLSFSVSLSCYPTSFEVKEEITPPPAAHHLSLFRLDLTRVTFERRAAKVRNETNIFLQRVVLEKSLRLYTNVANVVGRQEQRVLTFHNMLGVLEKLDSAIEMYLYIF